MIPLVAVLVGSQASAGATIPVAHRVSSIKTVGPLFFPSVAGLLPNLRGPHFCSASVVHSASHDLVVTAAHCIYGSGVTIEFAPGYHDYVAPYGVWSVRHIYIPLAWKTRQDPKADVAILQMAARGGRHIEDVVGAHPLGTPKAGSAVTVDGYPAGTGGQPITCTNQLYLTHGYPSFDCHGYVSGVSGGPWLVGGRVVGVTGGLHQGGCTERTSYSAPFGSSTAQLLHRADVNAPADFAPIAFISDC